MIKWFGCAMVERFFQWRCWAVKGVNLLPMSRHCSHKLQLHKIKTPPKQPCNNLLQFLQRPLAAWHGTMSKYIKRTRSINQFRWKYLTVAFLFDYQSIYTCWYHAWNICGMLDTFSISSGHWTAFNCRRNSRQKRDTQACVATTNVSCLLQIIHTWKLLFNKPYRWRRHLT